jgi:hypothetical protein
MVTLVFDLTFHYERGTLECPAIVDTPALEGAHGNTLTKGTGDTVGYPHAVVRRENIDDGFKQMFHMSASDPMNVVIENY